MVDPVKGPTTGKQDLRESSDSKCVSVGSPTNHLDFLKFRRIHQ